MMARSVTDGRLGRGKNEEVTRFQKYPSAEYSLRQPWSIRHLLYRSPPFWLEPQTSYLGRS